jgi:hypothetical protein
MQQRCIELDEAETQAWESDDAITMDDARATIRAQAQGLADDDGGTIEVYSADGIVLDAIDPRDELMAE